MSVYALILVAIGVAMDAFGASISRGAASRHTPALKVAGLFGGLALIAPVAGWAIGAAFYDLIEAYDHWIAFCLLTAIGAKMIADALSSGKDRTVDSPLIRPRTRFLIVLVSAVATNVDAAIFGIVLPGLHVDIWAAAAIIGAATFIASFAGTHLGRLTGAAFGHRAEIFGGALLIAIGTKILIEHTLLAGGIEAAALQSPIFG